MVLTNVCRSKTITTLHLSNPEDKFSKESSSIENLSNIFIVEFNYLHNTKNLTASLHRVS